MHRSALSGDLKKRHWAKLADTLISQSCLDHQVTLITLDHDVHLLPFRQDFAWQARHNNCSVGSALEERQAGVGDGGIVLIGDAAVVAEHLAFFGLD